MQNYARTQFSTIDATRRECSSSPYDDPLIKGVLLHQFEIDKQVRKLAEYLNEDYKGKQVIIVPVMLGGMVFCTDLQRWLTFDVIIDPISARSYKKTESTKKLEFLLDCQTDVSGKHVLLVEDIIDSGLSITYLKDYFLKKEPAILCIAALLSKDERRVVQVEADYTCFRIPNAFVVGYGMDYEGRFRQLPDLCVLDTLPKEK